MSELPDFVASCQWFARCVTRFEGRLISIGFQFKCTIYSVFCHLGWLGCLQVEVLCKVEVGSAWLLLFRVYTFALLVLMMCFTHSMVSSSLSVVELCSTD